MKKQTLLDRRYPFWLALPAVIIFSVFFILPIIMGTGLSMTNWDMELARIDFVGLRNYVNIFSDKYYWMAAKNTLIFAVSILLLRNILALLLALCLTDKLKTRNFLRTIFYIPSVLSYIVVGILVHSHPQIRWPAQPFPVRPGVHRVYRLAGERENSYGRRDNAGCLDVDRVPCGHIHRGLAGHTA